MALTKHWQTARKAAEYQGIGHMVNRVELVLKASFRKGDPTVARCQPQLECGPPFWGTTQRRVEADKS
jgi:hypothetical protein